MPLQRQQLRHLGLQAAQALGDSLRQHSGPGQLAGRAAASLPRLQVLLRLAVHAAGWHALLGCPARAADHALDVVPRCVDLLGCPLRHPAAGVAAGATNAAGVAAAAACHTPRACIPAADVACTAGDALCADREMQSSATTDTALAAGAVLDVLLHACTLQASALMSVRADQTCEEQKTHLHALPGGPRCTLTLRVVNVKRLHFHNKGTRKPAKPIQTVD